MNNRKAYNNSEFAACPRNKFEEKFSILHICEECTESYFCPCVKHPAHCKCDCSDHKLICFRCFNSDDHVEIPYGEHIEAFLDSENSYPLGHHVMAFWVSDIFRKILKERGERN